MMKSIKVTGLRFVLFIIAAVLLTYSASASQEAELSDDVHRADPPPFPNDGSLEAGAAAASHSSSSPPSSTSSEPEAVAVAVVATSVNLLDATGAGLRVNDSSSSLNSRSSSGKEFAEYQSEQNEVAVPTADADYPVDDVSSQVWSKIRHLHQKVRLKGEEADQEEEDASTFKYGYDDETGPGPSKTLSSSKIPTTIKSPQEHGRTKPLSPIQPSLPPSPPLAQTKSNNNDKDAVATNKPMYRLPASGTRKSKLLAAAASSASAEKEKGFAMLNGLDPKAERMGASVKKTATTTTSTAAPTQQQQMTTSGAPRLENKLMAMSGGGYGDGGDSYDNDDESSTALYGLEGDGSTSSDEFSLETEAAESDDDPEAYEEANKPNLDIVTKFLRIVESQHLLGDNCTAGTDFNLGEGVVDRYAQERFRLEGDVAVNRANWLTRLWKYADRQVLESEYLLHVNLYSMIEMDEDIFAAGNCYDK